MLLTVTPNPSIDLLFEADTLVWDDANRVAMPRRRAGGQGINVARAARALGGRALALATFGGATGRELRELLEAEGTPVAPVDIDGDTRLFVSVRERASGRSMLVNPRGPHLAGDVGPAIHAAVRDALAAERPRWVACCGSVPPGVPDTLYAEIGPFVRSAGARWVVDCDGEALRKAAEARCDLLVPNHHEAGRLLGRTIADRADAADAARALRDRWCDVAAITLGERGAVLARRDGVWHAQVAARGTGSAVGAGDAFLAALLLGLEDERAGPAEALRSAVAAGTAVLSSDGADLLRCSDYEALLREVRLVQLD